MEINVKNDEFIADILVVDDKIENIRFLSDFFSEKGYNVRKAINGEGALIAAKTVIPDLILLDINMPGMGGYEVCQELKKNPQTSSIPIIFLSAGDGIDDKLQAFEVGGVDYITKPFQLEEILVRIQTQLKIQSLQKNLQVRNEQLQETVTALQKTQAALASSEAELRALFKGMTESVIVFNSEGYYLKIADTNSQLVFPYDGQKIGKHLGEFLPEKTATILLSAIQKTLETNHPIEIEYSLMTEEGKMDLSANISPLSANSVLCVMRDIRERKRREEALQLIVEGTASKTGSEFFRACVRYLAEILGASYTLVTEYGNIEKNRLRTLSFWGENNFIQNIEYDLDGTPCAEVIRSAKYSCYYDNLIEIFSHKQILVDLKVRSYAGIPLIDSTGNAIGHIAVLDVNPMQDDETRELVLKIFAARAGAELERQMTDLALQESQEKSERLLLNVLPLPIVERLKQDTSAIAEHFDEVTILFADIVGFTPLSTRINPTELVNLLNEIFSAFDALTEKHGLEKIKTIGDAYMVVGGLPLAKPDHAEVIAQMSLDMQGAIRHFQAKYGEDFQIRIGINTGSVVAGVIGVKKFIYDLWGDAVNVASRMESSGLPGKIQVTEATYQRLKDKYKFEKRGQVTVKGKGEMTTYWLEKSLV